MKLDLDKVGKDKPMAYETLAQLRDAEGHSIINLNFEYTGKGLQTLILRDSETHYYSGAFFVYDEHALAELLNANTDILEIAGWPTEPQDFIRRVANEWAEEKTALFDLVCDAFGDKEHIGRTDKKVPDNDGRYQAQYLEMLRSKERKLKP